MSKTRQKIETIDYEEFSLTKRLDCHGRPLQAVVTLKHQSVDEKFVMVFGSLDDSVLPFPGFRILDIPRYYRLGFALGKSEIYVTFRQKHHPNASVELIERLQSFLLHQELCVGDTNHE